jgi:hypothetical protein
LGGTEAVSLLYSLKEVSHLAFVILTTVIESRAEGKQERTDQHALPLNNFEMAAAAAKTHELSRK